MILVILSERFEDLKTAILSSMNDGDQRDIARGIVKYRRLFDFLLPLRTLNLEHIKVTTDSWNVILQKAGIKEVIDGFSLSKKTSVYSGPMRARTILRLEDDTFYECRASVEMMYELARDWSDYISMKEYPRKIIAETLSEMSRPYGGFLHYVRKQLHEVYPQCFASDSTDELDNRNERATEDI